MGQKERTIRGSREYSPIWSKSQMFLLFSEKSRRWTPESTLEKRTPGKWRRIENNLQASCIVFIFSLWQIARCVCLQVTYATTLQQQRWDRKFDQIFYQFQTVGTVIYESFRTIVKAFSEYVIRNILKFYHHYSEIRLSQWYLWSSEQM